MDRAAASGGLIPAMVSTATANLAVLFRPQLDPAYGVYLLPWALAVVAAVIVWRGEGALRHAGLFGFTTFAVAWAGLAPRYSLRGWTAVRMFLFAIPSLLITVAVAMAKAPRRARWGAGCALAALSVWPPASADETFTCSARRPRWGGPPWATC